MSKILTSQEKILIWENSNFTITTPIIPHVDKFDGGHLIVSPKIPVQSIIYLNDNLLLEMYKLVGFCEKALISTLGKQQIEIPFTNNQDNGNWAVLNGKNKSLHIHVYGRAVNSVNQKFGQALFCPDPNTTFYDKNQSLTQLDIDEIRMFVEINLLIKKLIK